MKAFFYVVLAVAALSAAPAHAKVASQSTTGFSLSYEAEVAAEPKAAFDAFVRIAEWWDSAHTYSGDAKNLSIEVKPGGCWCETLPDGGFAEHMSVAGAMPGKSLLLKGGLGPLSLMGVQGTMVLKFAPKGKATVATMTYVIGGHDPRQFKDLPKVVDGVLGAAFKRYANFVVTGKP